MQGETVLCISTAAWDSLWRPIQQIMSRLAVQNRVLFFEPGRNPERPVGAELWRNLSNFFVRRSVKREGNLVVIQTPSSLPYARQHLPHSVLEVTVPVIAAINARVLVRHVRWLMRELGVVAPILWLYEPRHVGLAGKFGEKFVCYYNYDELANFVENQRLKAMLQHYDDLLTRRADVVFATGQAQWQRRVKTNPNTYLIPNAVDFDLFNTALSLNTCVPDDLSEMRKPIIGYAGWLGNQIDVALLLRIAEVFPSCSLVLVGPDEMPRDAAYHQLRSMQNVHFLGRKVVTALPSYLKAFDVALIPYQLAGYTVTAYPLKLHEYLAAGRAVVSTLLPELRPFSHVVRIAETDEDFLAKIADALDDHSPQAVEMRVATARMNTWDQRVAEIYRILQPRLCGMSTGEELRPVTIQNRG